MDISVISHPIEHAVGVYVGLLLLACGVGILARLTAHIPYTIALTLVGLVLGLTEFGPHIAETGFSHDLIFFVFLPPLLFQGAFHMELNRLLKHIAPIAGFAVPGVLVATLIVGGILYGLSPINTFVICLLFGAIVAPTDPVSVLALFKQARAPHDLRVLIEGESLFNDATGVVLFTIILQAALHGGRTPGVVSGIAEFAKVSAIGFGVGGALGLAVFFILRPLNDRLLENALCLVLAYGAFWLGEALHGSGVIASVTAGLLTGNFGRRLSMNQETRETVETFFESIDFLINSLLFILIGLELREIPRLTGPSMRMIGAAIVAMLVSRAAVVYTFYWGINQVGLRRPKPWKHVIFWGGLRGSIPIALLLHLPSADQLPEGSALAQARPLLLTAGFACVMFSLIVQGMTMKPLLKKLGVSEPDEATNEEAAR